MKTQPEIEILLNRYASLIRDFASYLVRRFKILGQDEAFSLCLEGFVKAGETYDGSKSILTFEQFAKLCMRNAHKAEVEKRFAVKRGHGMSHIHLDDVATDDGETFAEIIPDTGLDPAQAMIGVEDRVAVRRASAQMDSKERAIIHVCFGDLDHRPSVSEVCRRTGAARSKVVSTLAKFQRIVRREIFS